MTFLLRYWRLIAVVVAILTVLGALYAWGEGKEREGYDRAQAEMQVQLERERQHQREVNEESERVHQESLAKVRADAARELRRRPIRCVLDSASAVRAGRDPAEPAVGPGGESDVRSAPDLRSIIVQRGEACEGLRQQLIAIRERQERLRQGRSANSRSE